MNNEVFLFDVEILQREHAKSIAAMERAIAAMESANETLKSSNETLCLTVSALSDKIAKGE